MKKTSRKSSLTLRTETVRQLTPDALSAVAGGAVSNGTCASAYCKLEGTSSTMDSRCCPSEFCIKYY